jgi:hypothetical protein
LTESYLEQIQTILNVLFVIEKSDILFPGGDIGLRFYTAMVLMVIKTACG